LKTKFCVGRGVLGIVGASLLTLLAISSPAVASAGDHNPAAAPSAPASTGDSLYVGDDSDNSVEQFNAATGQDLGTFVSSGSGGLNGPRGILHEGNFLVSNQNVNQPFPGEIDKYGQADGKSLGAVVPHTDANAPFDPDGIIRGTDNRTLYVADRENSDNVKPGRVAKYDINTGHFLGNLDFSSFINNHDINPNSEFHPQGLVFGPDGLLYVSVRSFTDVTLGWILSYNTSTGAVRVVASNVGATDCSTKLHRPDGLTFGPNGKLYVTSFRADPNDIDRILIFDAAAGACADEIDLDQVSQPRAFAQYILFGPSGYLFVPITGNPPNAGSVRRYDVNTKAFTLFVAPGPSLGSGRGLTFGKTNPTTLAYPSS
jgi:hypothetical protein